MNETYRTICVFGFISGFLLQTTGQTLNFWLSSISVDVKRIGLFSLITLPYAINFLWSAFFDHFKLKIFFIKTKSRANWIIPISIFLSIILFTIGKISPLDRPLTLAILGLFIAFLSSSQDVILNAIRSEITPQNKFGSSSGNYILGYRIGMIASGPFAMYISNYFEWNIIYNYFSIIVLIFPVLIFKHLSKINYFSESEQAKIDDKTKINFKLIFGKLNNINLIIYVMVFLVLYKLPDNIKNTMLNPFLFYLEFSESQIATAGKLSGMMGAIVGTYIAKENMDNIGIYKGLIIYGTIHSLSHLGYIIILKSNTNVSLLFIITVFESITSGMSMTAYIAFITYLCSGKYRSIQYSIMSSMMGVSRTIFPSFSGFLAEYLGWFNFFLFCSILALPSMILIFYIKKKYSRIF